jgi:hypothetical protein
MTPEFGYTPPIGGTEFTKGKYTPPTGEKPPKSFFSTRDTTIQPPIEETNPKDTTIHPPIGETHLDPIAADINADIVAKEAAENAIESATPENFEDVLAGVEALDKPAEETTLDDLIADSLKN